MTADELREAAIELFGERGWVIDLAVALRVDRTTIYRYTHNQIAVPGPVEAAVKCWLETFRDTGKRPTL